jgi:DNA-binding transcriptional MerR regulator
MKNGEALWTLDELTAAVSQALSEGYEGAVSGRVRDVPDRRTIRYYTTLGLIDRPAEMRGRTAIYNRRHLLQIVAIKKLQARGRRLADVQQALTGRTDRELARIAGLDPPEGAGQSSVPASPRSDRDFWRQEPDAHAPAGPETEATDSGASSNVLASSEQRPRALFGIPLLEGVTLLLAPSRPVEVHDVEAIRAAAGPLIRTLTRSRLIDPREGGENP